MLVVPSTLLQTWETQLQRHIYPNALRCVRHYGNSRLHGNVQSLHETPDLVVTTFGTITTGYRKQSSRPDILFSTKWHRIVIDEAHTIRNNKAQCSKAVAAINARCRWAVSATPVQNRLSDFASLLRFLKAYPYDQKQLFEMDIVNCWNSSDSGEGVARLKRLTQALMLRRTKEMIQLPPREDRTVKLHFTRIEAEQYTNLETGVKQALDEDLNADLLPARTYASALTSINRLRRFCNMGMQGSPKFSHSWETLSQDVGSEWSTRAVQEAFDNLSAFGTLLCARCGLENDAEQSFSATNYRGVAQLTQCFKLLCSSCSPQVRPSFRCDHCPACPVASITPTISERQTPERDVDSCPSRPAGFPTKIQAVTQDLKSVTDEKR